MPSDPRPRLPADFGARVRALQDGGEPAPAKHASTVVLLRDVPADDDGDPGIEACLLRRVSTMAFAAGMHVFPGGGVDPADAQLPAEALSSSDWVGPTPEEWA